MKETDDISHGMLFPFFFFSLTITAGIEKDRHD